MACAMTNCITVKNAKYEQNSRAILESSPGFRFAERIREGLCFSQGAVDDSVLRRLVFEPKEIKHALCNCPAKH